MSALAVRPFDFEGHDVRVLDQKGEPWFVGRDICLALALRNPNDAMSRLPDDEKGIVNADTLGGVQQVMIVSEAGMYRLVLTSRTPAAERFKTWVVRDVLPAIRRHGVYGAPANDVGALQVMVATLTAQVHSLQETVERLAPKAQALDRLMGRDGAIIKAARQLSHLASVAAPQSGKMIPLLPAANVPRKTSAEEAMLAALRSAAIGNEAHLTVSDLMQITGFSRRTVNYALGNLSKAGVISRHFETGLPAITYLHSR